MEPFEIIRRLLEIAEKAPEYRVDIMSMRCTRGECNVCINLCKPNALNFALIHSRGHDEQEAATHLHS